MKIVSASKTKKYFKQAIINSFRNMIVNNRVMWGYYTLNESRTHRSIGMKLGGLDDIFFKSIGKHYYKILGNIGKSIFKIEVYYFPNNNEGYRTEAKLTLL